MSILSAGAVELAARRAGRAHAQLGQLQDSGYDAIARKFWAGARAGTGTAARNLRAIARACLLDLQPLALRTDERIESPRALAYVDPGGPGQPTRTSAGACGARPSGATATETACTSAARDRCGWYLRYCSRCSRAARPWYKALAFRGSFGRLSLAMAQACHKLRV